MKSKPSYIIPVLVIVTSVFSGCRTTFSVQDTAYDEVSQLLVGQKVYMVLTNSARIYVQNLTLGKDSTSWLSKNNNVLVQHTVATSEISKIVHIRHGSGAVTGMAMGGLGGMALGAIWGYSLDDIDREWRGVAGLIGGVRYGLYGLPIGALIGAIVGNRTTYELGNSTEFKQGDNVRIVSKQGQVYEGKVISFGQDVIYLQNEGKTGEYSGDPLSKLQ